MQTHTARTEAARVDALHALKILDTPREERYDRVVRLAQDVFGVKAAAVKASRAANALQRKAAKACRAPLRAPAARANPGATVNRVAIAESAGVATGRNAQSARSRAPRPASTVSF